MKKKLAEWASEHIVALSASIIAAVIVIVLMVVFWDWLSDGESGSTTVRNVGLVIGGAIALGIAGWRSVVADRLSRTAHRQAETAQADLLNKRYQESVGDPRQWPNSRPARRDLRAGGNWRSTTPRITTSRSCDYSVRLSAIPRPTSASSG